MIARTPSATPTSQAPARVKSRVTGRVLIIESRFYEAIADELARGVIAELEAAGVGFERVAVPGALEIAQALAQAVAHGLVAASAPTSRYCGAVALGCVIRGETSHYDIVCTNANHWLMEVAIRHCVPVGNGILTVDTEAQALARACGGRAGKGGDAARACLQLVGLAQRFQDQGA